MHSLAWRKGWSTTVGWIGSAVRPVPDPGQSCYNDRIASGVAGLTTGRGQYQTRGRPGSQQQLGGDRRNPVADAE